MKANIIQQTKFNMSMNEKSIVARTIKKTLKSASTSHGELTHVCICQGSYKITSKKWKNMNLYEQIGESSVPSICERLPKKFPLFFDIDGIDINIEELNKSILKIIENSFILEDDYNEYYISQNKAKKNSFHIYYPKIIVNKGICLTLADIINTESENKELIDPKPYKSGGLRMLGVLKWDKETKSYIENSGHLLISGSKQEILEQDLVSQMEYLSVRIPQSKNKVIKTTGFFNDKQASFSKKFVDSKYVKRDKKYFAKNIFNKEGLRWIVNTILMKCLDDKRLDSKELWTGVIFCLKNIEDNFYMKVKDIGIQWSYKSKHYKPGDPWVENQVESMWKSDKITKDYGIKKLYKLAKEDNKDAYHNLVKGVTKWGDRLTSSISIEYIRHCIEREDLGDAELFGRLYKLPEQRIICSGVKKGFDFWLWDGDLWKEDSGGHIKTLICAQLGSLYTRYICDLQKKISDLEEDDATDKEKLVEIKKAVEKRRRKVQTANHAKNIMPLVAAELFDGEFMPKLNSNKDIIACNNGVVELNNKGNLRCYRIDDYCTKKLKIDFPEDGLKLDTSDIESFFQDIMLDDNDMVRYLQTFLGYSMTGHIREQKFVVFWGELGSNGKSVLIELLRTVLEEKKYYATLSGDSLLKNRRSSPGSATPHLMPLFGARIAIVDESDKAVKLNEGMIKRITGNKTCTVRPLYKSEFTFEMMAQPILVTNFRPDISNDTALHRRLILIPFDAVFKDKEEYDADNPKHRIKDKRKQEKLENNIQQFLIWLINGAIQWYSDGTLPSFPDKIKNATERYKLESDTLYNFLNDDDLCRFPPSNEEYDEEDYFTATSKLLEEYVSESGLKCTKKDFVDKMAKHGHKEIKYRSKKGFQVQLGSILNIDDDD